MIITWSHKNCIVVDLYTYTTKTIEGKKIIKDLLL